MDIFRSIDEIKYDKNTVATIGTFDGVHLAHRSIIQRMKEIAQEKGERSLIVTFDPHPQEVLRTKTPDIKLLNTIDEKLEIFESLDIDAVYVQKFTVDFSRTTATEFYEKYITNTIGISDLIIGFDHLFGRDREGNINTLIELGNKFEFEVHRVEEIDINGEKVSSSRIRKHLSLGEIYEVNSLLGYEYYFSGRVVVGDKRGRTLGYPTANVESLTDNKALPGNGVYIVKVQTGDKTYGGMMNIGFRPTLTNALKHVMEINILDFDEDIYGSVLKIIFLRKLRNETKFSSKDELLKQLNKDKQEAIKYITNYKS